jgi:TolB-like protein
MHQKPITGEAIRTQLERILPSRGFVASQRLCRFLRFVVNRHLEGTADQLKESLIGTEVYDRNSSYDPSQDSIVRTEGRRLRTKLKEYYESEGVNDPVVIHFRLGSYAPQFREQNLPEETVPKRTGGEASVSEGTGVCVAVLPFTDLSGQPLATRCARDLTDELIHELTLTPGVRVAAASAITASANSTAILPELAKKLGVQLVFEGTVREEGGRLRVISRMVNFDGFQVGSQRFEAKADSQGLFTLTERLASALVYRVRPEQSAVKKLNATVSNSLLSVLPHLLGAELLLDEGSVVDIQRALLTFGEVDQALPNFGRPLCDIAQARCEIALRGVSDSNQQVVAAREAAEKAVALDPEMISARVVLAFPPGKRSLLPSSSICLPAARRRPSIFPTNRFSGHFPRMR